MTIYLLVFDRDPYAVMVEPYTARDLALARVPALTEHDQDRCSWCGRYSGDRLITHLNQVHGYHIRVLEKEVDVDAGPQQRVADAAVAWVLAWQRRRQLPVSYLTCTRVLGSGRWCHGTDAPCANCRSNRETNAIHSAAAKDAYRKLKVLRRAVLKPDAKLPVPKQPTNERSIRLRR